MSKAGEIAARPVAAGNSNVEENVNSEAVQKIPETRFHFTAFQDTYSLNQKKNDIGLTFEIEWPSLIWLNEAKDMGVGVRFAFDIVPYDDLGIGGILHGGISYSINLIDTQYVSLDMQTSILLSPLKLGGQIEAGPYLSFKTGGHSGSLGIKLTGIAGHDLKYRSTSEDDEAVHVSGGGGLIEPRDANNFAGLGVSFYTAH